MDEKDRARLKSFLNQPLKPGFLPVVVILAAVLVFSGFAAGIFTADFYPNLVRPYLEKIGLFLPSPAPSISPQAYLPQTSQEQAVINVVKKYSPAVVSIIITKDLPVYEQYYTTPFGDFFNDPFFQFQAPQYRQKGTEKKEVGGGSGFIISHDGIILTNKHVVLDEQAEYTVLTNDGQKYPAKVLARDPVQDLAVLKIEPGSTADKAGNLVQKPFTVVKLGDSAKLQIGQSVVAIGNSLGEFRNTVSVGVVSGLGRTITASDAASFVETLEDVIQTDAAINPGNSGGPLLNLQGEVIGINTATVSQAQSIGFALPINLAKRDIEQAKTSGKISYPFLGVRYVLINDKIQQDHKLPFNYGALISKGLNQEAAVTSGSVADKAGLKEGDVILEFDQEKITADNSLAKILQNYNPGQTVSLKIWSNGQEKTISLVLGERSE